MARDGTFRNDLYYRLRVGALTLPPLRERGGDILLLAEHFLRELAPASSMRLSAQARSSLASYDWPGNVRELRNVLSVAVAYADGEEVGPEHLDLPYRSTAASIGYHEKVFDYRRRLVSDALRAAGGNRAEAGRRLGLTRQAVSDWARKLGLDT